MSIQLDLWKQRAQITEKVKTESQPKPEQIEEELEFTYEEILFLESVCGLLEKGQLDEFIDPLSLVVGGGAVYLANKLGNKLGKMKAHRQAKKQLKARQKKQLSTLKNRYSGW